MPQERNTTVLASTPGKSEAQIKEELESRKERKAKIAAILNRGYVDSRLVVELPSDKFGQWIRNNSVDIQRYEALGFVLDSEFAPKRAIHNDGSDVAVVGDVVHMICSKETKEILDEINQEEIRRIHNPKRPIEESTYEESTYKDTDGVIPTTNTSKTEKVGAADISDALRTLEFQRQLGR